MTDAIDGQLAAQYEAYPYPRRDPKDEARRLIVGSPGHMREIDLGIFGAPRPASRPLHALFAGGDAGMPGGHVQRVPEDVHARLCSAFVGHLERVHLLVTAIGFDDHQASRPEPQRLGQAVPAMQSGDNRIEGPYFRRAAISQPPIVDRAEPVRIPMIRLRLAGRRMVPGRMGQQEVDPGRSQRHQRLVYHQRIVG